MDGNEEVSRMLREHTDRIDRLENAEYREAIPNPIIDTGPDENTTMTGDVAAVDLTQPGSFSWGSSWGINSWPIHNTEKRYLTAIREGETVTVEPGETAYVRGFLDNSGTLINDGTIIYEDS